MGECGPPVKAFAHTELESTAQQQLSVDGRRLQRLPYYKAGAFSGERSTCSFAKYVLFVW
jgi:hypothetical protein